MSIYLLLVIVDLNQDLFAVKQKIHTALLPNS